MVKRHVNGFCIREVNIRPPVAVVVDKSHSPAHGFRNVFPFSRGNVLEVDAGRGRDVDQFGIVSKIPREFSLCLCFFALLGGERSRGAHLRHRSGGETEQEWQDPAQNPDPPERPRGDTLRPAPIFDPTPPRPLLWAGFAALYRALVSSLSCL